MYASVVQQKLASCIIELCVCMQVSSVHRNTQDLHWWDGTGDVGRLPPGSPSTPVTYPRNTSDGKIDSPGRIKSICVTKSELQFSIRYNPWLVTDSQQILILKWVRMSYFISFSFRFQFLGFLVWHYSIMQDCTKLQTTKSYPQTTTAKLRLYIYSRYELTYCSITSAANRIVSGLESLNCFLLWWIAHH